MDHIESVAQKISHERKVRNLRPGAEHLIILVGSNPLPCYVAALALHPSLVIPVCTRDTMEIGMRLIYALENRGIRCRVPTEIKSPSNADDIRATLESIPNLEKCGLHYTGGKKTMSVHAYRTWIAEAQDISQASYIDAQEMVLIFDGTTLRADLRFGPTVDIDTVFSLHGIRPHSSTGYKRAPRIEGLAEVRLGHIAENGPASLADGDSPEYREFPAPMKTFFDKHYNRGSHRYTFDQFCCDYLGYPEKPLDSVPGKSKTCKVERWLRAEWLEEYVWSQLQTIADQERLTDIVYDVNMLTTGDVQFQVDVVGLRGHTLFVFSCTTEDHHRDVLKNKVFEAQVRARQLGGDQARYALVCLAPKGLVMSLEREVKGAWNAVEYFRIFGWDDVTGNLAGQMGDWIRKV